MADEMTKTAQNPASNRVVVTACVLFVTFMVGASYAAVPLYDLFCRVTGYGGTTQRAEVASNVVLDRTIKVRFDSNVSGGLGWDFKPVTRQVELKIGQSMQVAYVATNSSNRTVTGQASFNVTPQSAGAYFNKIQCFCFTETKLMPGESIDMPVVFFVDPAIVDDEDAKKVTTITLSYTFFPHKAEKPVAAVAEPVQEKTNL